MTAANIKQQLLAFGNPLKAEHAKYFFKTGKGQYGEGDRFMGCTVPETRGVAGKFMQTPFGELEILLNDDLHECRLCALIILVAQFQKAGDLARRRLLILSAHTIGSTTGSGRSVVLPHHRCLVEGQEDRSCFTGWQKATSCGNSARNCFNNGFHPKQDFSDMLNLCELFLTHKHDLMHKACGWMLREAGKRDEAVLTGFLDNHHPKMPRTMLRYAIERLSPEQKNHYMMRPGK